jgi:PIN domain nuclease of toxin-antitoxin system
MTVLLDTQSWLWAAGFEEHLSAEARRLISSSDHRLYLSVASMWEIAIKYAAGKLRLPEPPASFVPSRLLAMGIASLTISPDHALHVATMPLHHRDPFDRLLIAQAQLEDLAILTSDPHFAAYDVTVIPAT